jgi:hypothetical protein
VVAARLSELLARSAGPGPGAGGIDIEAATDDELFDLVDNGLFTGAESDAE